MGVRKDMFCKPHPDQLSEDCELLKLAGVDLCLYRQNFENFQDLTTQDNDFLRAYHPAYELLKDIMDTPETETDSSDAEISQPTVGAESLTPVHSSMHSSQPLSEEINPDNSNSARLPSATQVEGPRLSLSDLMTTKGEPLVKVTVKRTGEGMCDSNVFHVKL